MGTRYRADGTGMGDLRPQLKVNFTKTLSQV